MRRPASRRRSLDLGRPVRTEGRAAADQRQALRRSRRDPANAGRQGAIRGRRRRDTEACARGVHRADQAEAASLNERRRAEGRASSRSRRRADVTASCRPSALPGMAACVYPCASWLPDAGRRPRLIGEEAGVRIRSQKRFLVRDASSSRSASPSWCSPRNTASARRHAWGPGYFPTLLGGLLAVLGVYAVGAGARHASGDAFPAPAPASAADRCSPASSSFALLLQPLGFVLAVDRSSSWSAGSPIRNCDPSETAALRSFLTVFSVGCLCRSAGPADPSVAGAL